MRADETSGRGGDRAIRRERVPRRAVRALAVAGLPLPLVLLAACRSAELLPGAPAPASRAAVPEPAFRTTVDLDGDGADEALAAYLAPDGRRGFLTAGAAAEPWTSPTYPMWKAAVGRLANAPERFVLLGIWSHTPRHAEPQPHRTVWVLGWDGRRLVERWRGSALARPLRDFAPADLDRDGVDELLALEETPDSCWATAYRWDGFGFVGAARRPLPCPGLRFREGGPEPLLEVSGAPRRAALHGRTLRLEEVVK